MSISARRRLPVFRWSSAAWRASLERYATPELLPVAEQDLCGGLPCPQPPPLIDVQPR